MEKDWQYKPKERSFSLGSKKHLKTFTKHTKISKLMNGKLVLIVILEPIDLKTAINAKDLDLEIKM